METCPTLGRTTYSRRFVLFAVTGRGQVWKPALRSVALPIRVDSCYSRLQAGGRYGNLPYARWQYLTYSRGFALFAVTTGSILGWIGKAWYYIIAAGTFAGLVRNLTALGKWTSLLEKVSGAIVLAVGFYFLWIA